MYSIVNSANHNLPDVRAFIERLNTLEQSPISEARELFAPRTELIVTRAPGRLDIMGGIGDYSGSLVMELPILEATFVALQRDPARRLKIISSVDEASQA